MKMVKTLGILVTLTGVGALALLAAPSVYGQPPDRPFDAQARRGRELMVLSGRGAEIGVHITEVPDGAAGGVKIDEVEPDSPADKAGLKRGDVIAEFDGERVRGGRQFARLVQETPAGRTVKATVVRDGQKKEIQITPGEGHGMSGRMIDGNRLRDHLGDLDALRGDLGALREYMRPFNFNVNPDVPGMMSSGRLGVTVDDLTGQLAQYFGVKEGVVVASVTDGSAAAHAGIKAGDVITSINGQRVASREDLLRGLREAMRSDGAPGSSSETDVKLGIVRDKKEMTVTAKIEAPRRTLRGRPA